MESTFNPIFYDKSYVEKQEVASAAPKQDTDERACSILDIEDGMDLGIVVDYLRELHQQGTLKVDLSKMKVGRVFIEDDQLIFENDETGEKEKVNKAFCDSKVRALLGTYRPSHIRAVRRNLDHSWTVVDSLNPAQPVHDHLFEYLQTTLSRESDQIQGERDQFVALPFVIL